MDVTFIVHSDWLENIKTLPPEQQDKIIADIVRYGAEMPLQHEDDIIVASFVNFVKGSIDNSKNLYKTKVENGQTRGRKKTIDDKEVWELAKGGMTAAQIAEKLGVNKSSIDHNAGWQNRKNLNYFSQCAWSKLYKSWFYESLKPRCRSCFI